MPAEWEPHVATWMQFPTGNFTFGPSGSESLDRYQQAWAAVANAVARFEPVLVAVNPDDVDAARDHLGEGAEIYVTAIDDAWCRDSGPTFLVDGRGGLAAAHWRFNAWGNGKYLSHEHDARVGAVIAAASGARIFESAMVNEGGGIHVDGAGTVIITETVQLDPDRNPGWTAQQVEEELAAMIGVQKVIWLPRGLTKDYDEFGTSGHVDILATFTPTGKVLVHRQQDPAHPDFAVSDEIISVLRGSVDAHGRALDVVEVAAPVTGWEDDRPVDWSYINHYVCNGAVIMCAFDDPGDQRAAEVLAKAYPGREIVLVDARPIFARGGGIHCITQQQPAGRS